MRRECKVRLTCHNTSYDSNEKIKTHKNGVTMVYIGVDWHNQPSDQHSSWQLNQLHNNSH